MGQKDDTEDIILKEIGKTTRFNCEGGLEYI